MESTEEVLFSSGNQYDADDYGDDDEDEDDADDDGDDNKVLAYYVM